MPKTPDFIINMKQPPRSAKHGHRRPGSKNHGSAIDRAGAGTGRATTSTIKPTPTSPFTVDPNALIASFDPGAIADLMTQAQQLLAQKIISQNIMYGFRENAEPKIPHEGVIAGEIIGYRLWWIDKSGDLRSINQDHVTWTDGSMTGNVDDLVCRTISGKVRYAGVYAFKSINRAAAEFFEGLEYIRKGIRDRPSNAVGIAIGSVKLWGEVVEHTDGYRAQFARVHEIEAKYILDR